MGPLSARALQGLKAYTYKSSGTTILDDLHNPAWNYLVNLLPTWVAPNLVTLAGLVCIVVAYILNVIYLPNFEGDAPRWVYLATMLSVFLYVNLDCMDGKQARRTGSSSPLGQLFDHGCDAFALHMILANIASSMELTPSWKMGAGCLGIMVPWMLAQWEEYHTGIMVYGTRLYGVLEANYSICLVHLVNLCCGTALWRTPITVPQVLASHFRAISTVGDVSLLLVFVAGIAQASHNVVRVFNATAPQMSEKERGFKQLGPWNAFVHLLTLLVIMGLGAAWIQQMQGADAVTSRAVFSTFGILYALTASQLIVAHMAKEPFYPSPMVLLCLLAGVLNNALGAVHSLPATLVLHTVAAIAYLGYVLPVVSQLCDYLGIKAFSIKYQKC